MRIFIKNHCTLHLILRREFLAGMFRKLLLKSAAPIKCRITKFGHFVYLKFSLVPWVCALAPSITTYVFDFVRPTYLTTWTSKLGSVGSLCVPNISLMLLRHMNWSLKRREVFITEFSKVTCVSGLIQFQYPRLCNCVCLVV